MKSTRELVEQGRIPLPAVGALRAQDPPLIPWIVIDAAGLEIEPLNSFLRDLFLSDSSPLTLRSYGYDLLRWWRLLDVMQVAWDRAARDEVVLLVGWLRTSPNPQRSTTSGGLAAGSVNLRTGKPTPRAGYAAATINHALTVISGFYAFHAQFGRGPALNPVPADGRARLIAHRAPDTPLTAHRRAPLRQRQEERRPRPIPDAQWAELSAVMACHRDRALLAFYASSGARASELLGVTGDRVDWAAQQLWVVSKGNRALEPVPGSPEAFTHLALYFDEAGTPGSDEPVWRTRRGDSRPLTYWAMRRVLQRANERLGTNWTLHDLRHTLASQLANDPTLTLTDVQTVMRHRQLSTTQRYVHTDVEQLHDRLQEHYLHPSPPQTYSPGYDVDDITAVFGE